MFRSRKIWVYLNAYLRYVFLCILSLIRALHRCGTCFHLPRKDIKSLFACLFMCSSFCFLLISFRHGFITQSPLTDLPTIQRDIQRTIRNKTIITLAYHILSTNPNSNVVFSPLSIHVVLGLIAAGSCGQTLDQLLKFLKANSIDDLNNASILQSLYPWSCLMVVQMAALIYIL